MVFPDSAADTNPGRVFGSGFFDRISVFLPDPNILAVPNLDYLVGPDPTILIRSGSG